MYTPILKKYASYEFREYSLTCKKNREQGKKSKKLFFIILKYHISYYHIYNTEEVFFRVNKKRLSPLLAIREFKRHLHLLFVRRNDG